MNVAELRDAIRDAPDDARVLLNDEPLAAVEICPSSGDGDEVGPPIVMLWDLRHS